jgi:hypothetical protein
VLSEPLPKACRREGAQNPCARNGSFMKVPMPSDLADTGKASTCASQVRQTLATVGGVPESVDPQQA